MLHFGCRVTFGVNVADLFELQCTFKGRWKIVVTTEVKKVITVLVLFRDFGDVIILFERELDLIGNRLDSLDHFTTFIVAHMSQATQIKSQHHQRHTL